ncbi:hypothetical protein PATSB16_26790 [Pandoraea thiooxydans]|nr:hypothetical protein PATSB16_26790 [Pandoraea thiooxydans]
MGLIKRLIIREIPSPPVSHRRHSGAQAAPAPAVRNGALTDAAKLLHSGHPFPR